MKTEDMTLEEIDSLINTYEIRILKDQKKVELQEQIAALKIARESKANEENLKEIRLEESYENDASFLRRTLAFLIDNSIYGVILQITIAFFTSLINDDSLITVRMILHSGLIILTLYFYFISPILKNGQTFGKRCLRIKIVNMNKNPSISLTTVLKREILGKTISSLFFGLGFLIRIFGVEALHDSIASTKVIYIKNNK